MSTRAPKRYTDGFSTLEGGMYSGVHPSLVGLNQFSYGVNVRVRGGYATNRPGFKPFLLNFADEEAETWFKTKNVQGAGYYQQSNGTPVIITSIGGRIFAVYPLNPPNSDNVIELTDGDVNSEKEIQAWMIQAEQYFIIQNGVDRPFIYDGATLRRSVAAQDEVPVGKMMEYGVGRLIVVLPNQREYVIGDIVGGGTSVIRFTESRVVNEGGSITVPIPGSITAVKLIAVLDRGTRQGDLVVHTDQGAVTAQIGAPRTTWKEIQFQQIAILKNGSLSQNATVLVNGDMFYRAYDGIRSLAMAQRDFQSQWATTPVSREVERVLRLDNVSLLSVGSAVLFDNRIIMTCTPYPRGFGFYHKGLISLDFDPISSMGQKSPPAYDGLWTGLQATALVVGAFNNAERCFAFHVNGDWENEIWEISRDDAFDDQDVQIPATIESRSYLFAAPFSLKNLDSGDLWIDRLEGSVTFDIKFKPDQYPLWTDWHTWSECASKMTCEQDSIGCMTLTNYQPQYRPRMQLPQPADNCVTGNEKPLRMGYQFQTRIAWMGKARIQGFRIHAQDIDEPPYGCRQSTACTALTGCNDDPATYRVS